MIMIVVKRILYLIYLSPCPDLGLFMSYLYHLFFLFSLICIAINHITSQTYLLFVNFLEYRLLFLDDNVDKENEAFSNSKSSAQGLA